MFNGESNACLKHSNLLTVNVPKHTPKAMLREIRRNQKVNVHFELTLFDFIPKFDYELFNYSNTNIHYWSWNYRGCWPLQIPSLGSYTKYFLFVIKLGIQSALGYGYIP